MTALPSLGPWHDALRGALQLAADLLTAAEAAHATLAPIAETDPAAAAACERLSAAIAAARPSTRLPTPVQVHT